MKKNDNLLKRIELFEKLALYSDKNKFLKILSQQNNLIQGTDPKTQLINNVGYVEDRGGITNTQQKLKEKGMNLKVDGIWGPESYKAMCDFQQKNNLPVTGKSDNATAKLLWPEEF